MRLTISLLLWGALVSQAIAEGKHHSLSRAPSPSVRQAGATASHHDDPPTPLPASVPVIASTQCLPRPSVRTGSLAR